MSKTRKLAGSVSENVPDKVTDTEEERNDASDSDNELWFEASAKVQKETLEHPTTNSSGNATTSECTSTNNKEDQTKGGNAAVKNECSDICPIHKGKVIEFFCKSCDKIGCSACMITEHKFCPNADYIGHLAEQLFDNEEYVNFRQALASMAFSLEMNKNRYELNNNNRGNLKANALLAIKHQRDEINNLFDHLEAKVRSTLEERDNIEKSNLNEVSQQHYTLATDLQIMSSDIEYKHKTGQKCQLFIAMKKAAEQLPHMKRQLENLEARNEINRYEFIPSAGLATMSDLKEFGTIKLYKSDIKQTLRTRKAIKIDTKQDKQPCTITGICVLSNHNLVVVADNANRKLKVIDVQNENMLSYLDMSSDPWEITKIEDKQIAVTVPLEGVVKFLSVMPSNDLHEEHEIKVSGECYGIAYTQKSFDILLVSFKRPFATVKFLDMKGQVLKTFDRSVSGKHRLQWPDHLALSPDQNLVYVPDFSTNRVVFMNFEGKIVALCEDSDMREPTAVAADKNGYVYILSGHGEICQLSENCSKVHLVQTLPCGGRSIAYCSIKNKLYIGMAKKNVINVFEII